MPENSSKRKELHPDDQRDDEPFDANETSRPTKAASSSAIFKNTPTRCIIPDILKVGTLISLFLVYPHTN
ncbi:hypothetical protein NW754_003944 [Fusarium falciforme]|nr:hypothetical protein NW754_003944 [Fusarium falciforme]